MTVKEKSFSFRIADFLLLTGFLLPFIIGIMLYIILEPASEGIEIAGAKIYFTLHMPLQDLPITESQVNSWLVIIALFFLETEIDVSETLSLFFFAFGLVF